MVCLGVEFHNNNRNCFLRMQVVIRCVLFCGLTPDWSSNQQLHHTTLHSFIRSCVLQTEVTLAMDKYYYWA